MSIVCGVPDEANEKINRAVGNMSFDVFFHTCNLSDQTKQAVNPFTGETIQNPVGESVTSEERRALKQVLASAGGSTPGEHGCYVPILADDSSAEVYFDGLADAPEFSGGMVALRGTSIELATFLYALADAGNLAMLPAMDGDITLVTSTANAKRVASRWPDAIVVESPDDLHAILTQGFDGWKQYRDQVIGD